MPLLRLAGSSMSAEPTPVEITNWPGGSTAYDVIALLLPVLTFFIGAAISWRIARANQQSAADLSQVEAARGLLQQRADQLEAQSRSAYEASEAARSRWTVIVGTLHKVAELLSSDTIAGDELPELSGTQGLTLAREHKDDYSRLALELDRLQDGGSRAERDSLAKSAGVLAGQLSPEMDRASAFADDLKREHTESQARARELRLAAVEFIDMPR